MKTYQIRGKTYYDPKPNLPISTIEDAEALAKEYEGAIIRQKKDASKLHKYMILVPLHDKE